jgi:hypothetical protein
MLSQFLIHLIKGLKMNTMQGLKDYIKALESHDWFYNYSDDHQAYMTGSSEKDILRKLAMIYDHNFQIWDSIAPNQYKKGAY